MGVVVLMEDWIEEAEKQIFEETAEDDSSVVAVVVDALLAAVAFA